MGNNGARHWHLEIISICNPPSKKKTNKSMPNNPERLLGLTIKESPYLRENDELQGLGKD